MIGIVITIAKLMGIVIGPAIIFATLKAIREGEGVYDDSSRNYMRGANLWAILFGLALTAYSAYSIYEMVRPLTE